MKSPFFLCIFLMFLAVNALQAFAATDSLTVLTPHDKTYVESRFLGIVLVVPKDSMDAVSIAVNNEKPVRFNRKDNYYVCAGITLSEGPNKITIEGLRHGSVVEERTLDLFYRLDLSAMYNSAPPGFDRYRFHVPESEKNCIFCHQLDDKTDGGNAGQDQCMPCHKRTVAYRYMHGPSVVGACDTCHRPKAKDGKYGVPQPYSGICYQCHSETMDAWNALEKKHGPYALGNCTLCHSPHGAEYPYFVRKHTTDLCLSCHEDKASGSHVVTFFDGRGHPVRNRPDPLHPGRELTCASCHNPHASKFNHLLFQDEEDVNRFCKACHRF